MSSDARFVLWTAATLMFFDHPWLGIGLENYKFLLPEYVISAHDLLGFVEFEAMVYTAWAHNEFLQLISEGGGIVLLALVSAMICLFYPLFMFFRGRREWSPLKLYSHFFLIPFVIQSMFSWPLRYAPLLILFFTFVALLVSQYSGISVNLSWIHRLLLRFLCLCGLTFVLFIGFQEFHMGYLAKQIKYSSYQKTFAEFENLVTSDYIEYPLLMEAVPRYVKVSVDNNDITLAKKILPHVERLTEIHGAHWQWSYLAHIYLLLDRRDDAMVAITRAINLWPTKEMYWSFQHYLNMLKAAEHTGRPVNDFLPLQPGQTAQDLEGIFDFADRFRIYQ
jgi:hypothetical protein